MLLRTLARRFDGTAHLPFAPTTSHPAVGRDAVRGRERLLSGARQRGVCKEGAGENGVATERYNLGIGGTTLLSPPAFDDVFVHLSTTVAGNVDAIRRVSDTTPILTITRA